MVRFQLDRVKQVVVKFIQAVELLAIDFANLLFNETSHHFFEGSVLAYNKEIEREFIKFLAFRTILLILLRFPVAEAVNDELAPQILLVSEILRNKCCDCIK